MTLLLAMTSLFILLLLLLMTLHLQSLVRLVAATMLQKKQTENTCTAKNIHISPASSVDRISNTIDMYVSFTLDYPHCRDESVTIYFALMSSEKQPTDDDKISISTQTEFEILQFESFRHSWNVKPYQSSFIYHGILEKLQSSTDYWYRIQVGNDDTPPLNSIPFTTPTALGQPTTLAIVGDWGQTSSSMQTMELIWNATQGRKTTTLHSKDGLRYGQQRNYLTRSSKNNALLSILPPPNPSVSAVLVLGDLSYANGQLPLWESWLTKMQQPLFQSTPLLVAAGNHELECDARDYKIFQPYENYFRTPHHRSPTDWQPVPISQRWRSCTHPSQQLWSVYEGGNSYYQYRQGLAHLIVLNSYTNTSVGSPQYLWLQDVLEQQVDRTITPWLIIAFHAPFYSTFRGHNHEINPQIMNEAMEPLFVQYQVNMVFSGHHHAYVRSYPMRHGQVDPHGIGPVYFTVGTGGDSHSLGPLHRNNNKWVAARDHTTFGAGQLQFVNATHAHWKRLLWSSNVVSVEKTDEVWLENYFVTPHSPTVQWQ